MRSPSAKHEMRVRSVCIIGAGPSGLAAAKYLVAEKAFPCIKIYEQRATVGGLWNYITCPEETSLARNVPQTDPHGEHDLPIWPGRKCENSSIEYSNDEPAFMSPLYDTLETNIPRGLMGFSDLDWPETCQLFPEHESVLDYLQRYANDLRHLIVFQTQVRDVRMNETGRWLVTTQKVSQEPKIEPQVHKFDAVVVASGHFNVPYVPSVPGMEAWNEAYPGTILHSMIYRRAESYANLKVIVVGNSASGVDIAGQIATVCDLPLLQSQKSESFLQPDKSTSKVEKPEIVEFIPQGRRVRFADRSIEHNVDAILYCTGYFYSYPFLSSLAPPVIASGEYVQNLYQHIFYRPQPSLAFVALNQKIIPFPVAEAQCAVIARAWSNRLMLPSEQQMADWEQKTLAETGGGRSFHVLKFPKDADYIDMMHDWAMIADQEHPLYHELNKRRMSENRANTAEKRLAHAAHPGKEPPYWGEKEYWTRERFPAIKKTFQSFGEERRSKRTLEDVGFSFEDWKREKIEEGRTLL